MQVLKAGQAKTPRRSHTGTSGARPASECCYARRYPVPQNRPQQVQLVLAQAAAPEDLSRSVCVISNDRLDVRSGTKPRWPSGVLRPAAEQARAPARRYWR